jgi:hypothetical protein
MTKHHAFSRSFASMFAIATLATGIALIAAPATARAETGTPIAASGANVDCAPCEALKVYDKDGLSFSDVVAEVQNGQIVITAEIAVTGTAGRPRIGSVIYTDDTCMPAQMSRQAGTQACDAISRALLDAAAPVTTAPGPLITGPSTPTEGIIMRDGGVCDPIRHMGC